MIPTNPYEVHDSCNATFNRYYAWQEGFDNLKKWLFTDCDNPRHKFKGQKFECPGCMRELQL
jgi:hypothetical protein